MTMTMTTGLVLVLVSLLPLISALDNERLEQIRRLHEHDGIDTATVHVSYPHSPAYRRLTKREAVDNLSSRRHNNFTVKVTLMSSGRVLDLHLQPSQLRVQGALVKVMQAGETEQEYSVLDEGCHYQGSFDEGRGLASVHFCDGVLVGAAHNGLTEYSFHSHRHPLPDDDDDDDNDGDIVAEARDEEPHPTIVSWKDASRHTPYGDPARRAEWERTGRRKRQVDVSPDVDPPPDGEYDITADEQPEAPVEAGEESRSAEYEPSKTPVTEFGVIFDEDFLRDFGFLYPTRRDLLNLLISKFTGVQALYGSPEVTGFNLIIQIKAVFMWRKNPPWYPGSKIYIARRMGAGGNFSKENAMYKATDVGVLFTSQAPGRVEGIALLGGACKWKAKTFVSRNWGSGWNNVAHEFGHTLGLGHVPGPCQNATPPYNRGFMNSYRNMLLPCYKEVLERRLQTKALRCLFVKNVNTTNVPPLHLPATFPVVGLGLNQYCRTFLRNSAVFVAEESKPCGSVLCAVTNASSAEFSQAQVTSGNALPGRSCGPNGEICIERSCKSPTGNTTVTVVDRVTGTGTWGRWSGYSRACTSACGVGVRISTRTCSKPDRVEACKGPRFRAKLCNTQPCPGDDLRSERDIRSDRGNYSCSLLKARDGAVSPYIRPFAKSFPVYQLSSPMTVESCLVTCFLEPRTQGQPRLQTRQFGRVLQTDGTFCGPINKFDRHVLGVTARCLRGRCIEFGCDGVSMENRDGKIRDLCGVCGGDASKCHSGKTTVHLAKGQIEPIVELPAGTKNILFAVRSNGTDIQLRYMKLALMTKEDRSVIVPGLRGRFRIVTNDKNPLYFAGTHWTSIDNSFLSAPGPLDQPMRIKAKYMGRSSTAVEAVVVWGYKLPSPVPPPPTCQNDGVANVTNGGCTCVKRNTFGRQCELPCHDLCFNGGLTQDRCRCDCSNNPRTSPSTRCGCLPAFAGPSCSQCAVRHCFNGGTRNETTCQCQCPAGCRSKPDCSDCNYNRLLPGYKGQYGRGSLEEELKPPGKRDVPGEDTNGQPSAYRQAGHSPKLLAALWSLSALVGLPLS